MPPSPYILINFHLRLILMINIRTLLQRTQQSAESLKDPVECITKMSFCVRMAGRGSELASKCGRDFKAVSSSYPPFGHHLLRHQVMYNNGSRRSRKGEPGQLVS